MFGKKWSLSLTRKSVIYQVEIGFLSSFLWKFSIQAKTAETMADKYD